ncbi:squamosa promoter-binding-like protein 7 isoform X2 [Helianthus annuus]|uniref:squamosa promoter-binding-like protein 7 isoform X2 n=1 Tax=Helianthus annuus TaxID=4232 RepID=UPI001652E9B1|nr:squamosa promoter-binding-like protein 7 isoform X2 [Helianthus annuus]
MHNPPPPSPPPFTMDSIDDSSTSIWDWSQFLDFNVDDHLPFPTDLSPLISTSPDLYPIDDQPLQPLTDSFPVISTSNTNARVRKRDPRMACPNFLAGRVPCACPELDAQLAAEEEEEAASKKKKRAVTVRKSSGGSRCQVSGCETDISELKGYHKRHRVCLRCAYAGSVVIDGESKRYCQQCGKFHVLSDFDEGKRSCRRKLERHNNRRRRKSTDSKASGPHLTAVYDDEAGKGGKSTSGETAAGEKSSLAGGDHNSLAIIAQNIQSDSIPSLAASGETQTDEEKEKTTHSPSYGDDKTDFSSMCTTGRISFKLYDWNPAEFPRRLRHQIFQWLASMPVELEGYVRPGCTILTIFIAMPRFMWLKLDEDPVVCIHDLLASPRSLLSGRDTFFVNLNNTIYSVMKGGKSVIEIKVGGKSPRLHYVQPTCFEAGKPIEFLACGSNLLQPRLRFLVSFAGKYMTNDVRVSPSCNTSSTNLDHQLLNIRVPHSEMDVFGPAFIEGTVNRATEVLNQRLEKTVNHGLHPSDILLNNDDDPFISTVNQVHEESEKVGLLNADCVMNVTPYKEQPKKPSNRMFNYKTTRFFTLRLLILAVASVTVCFGICAVVFHPHKAAAIAINIHRCLFDDN